MKLENWSPGYAVARPIIRFVHRLMYRKYQVLGKENIKGGQPIIFAPNHQNALSDALIVLFATLFQPVWLARADIFASKAVAGILHFMKMSPVYRIRDGKDSLGKNQEVFDMAIRVLKNKRQLALFPEATHSGKRQAIVHKKAVPRIAFMAGEETNFELDIKIVPTGIYYSHYYAFDKDGLVVFGKPLNLIDYKERYLQSPSEATNALRKDLNQAVLDISFNIPSKKHYEVYEFLREVVGRDAEKTQPETKRSLYKAIKRDQKIVDRMYAGELAGEPAFEELLQQGGAYKNLLESFAVTDNAVVAGRPSVARIVGTGLLLLLFAPFALLGYVAHYFLRPFPLKMIRNKIKEEAFWDSFLMVIALVGGVVFYALYALLLTLVFHTWYITVGVLLLLPVTAKIAHRWNNALKNLRMRLRLKGSAATQLNTIRKDVLTAYHRLK